MRVNFNPDQIDWRPFFNEPQVGGAYFRGRPPMRGSGIGTAVGSFVRLILPFLSKVGKEIGREGLAAGSRILGDIATGNNPVESIKTHVREGAKNLADKASEKLQKGSGKKRRAKTVQKGRGKKIHIYNPVKPSSHKRKHHSYTNPVEERRLSNFTPKKKSKRKKPKLQKFDSLGPY